MPLQRIFTAEVMESLLQREGGIAQTIKALVGFTSQGQDVRDQGLRLTLRHLNGPECYPT
jgi:hypothetical protein